MWKEGSGKREEGKWREGRKRGERKSQLVHKGLSIDRDTHKLTGKLLMAGVFLSWSAWVKASQWHRRSNT